MENKEIYVDGVDVSGCRYLFDDTSYKRSKTSCSITLKDCKYLGNNCYYKQLKAKEQECEELKKIIDEAKNSKLDLKSFLVGEAVQNEYEQQLDQLKAEIKELKRKNARKRTGLKKKQSLISQLKAENEELKHQHQSDKGLITATGKMNYQLLQEYDKLKTALTEIKEIAEWKNEYWSLGIDDYKNMADEILQKISECEVK